MAAGGGQLFRPARQRLRLRLSALRAQGARQRPTYGAVPLYARTAARQRGPRDAAADARLPARPGLARGALVAPARLECKAAGRLCCLTTCERLAASDACQRDSAVVHGPLADGSTAIWVAPRIETPRARSIAQ